MTVIMQNNRLNLSSTENLGFGIMALSTPNLGATMLNQALVFIILGATALVLSVVVLQQNPNIVFHVSHLIFIRFERNKK